MDSPGFVTPVNSISSPLADTVDFEDVSTAPFKTTSLSDASIKANPFGALPTALATPFSSITTSVKPRLNRADSPRGTDYSHCRAVHAEQNAIISADRKEMINGTLYLVGKLCENGVETDYVNSPDACCLCKRMIINSGIKNIIVRLDKENYKEINVSDLTEEDIIGGY